MKWVFAAAVAKELEVNPPAYSVKWEPEIEDRKSHYFFVRVWNAGGGDAAKSDPKKPIAWLAPVWTGRGENPKSETRNPNQ
jgi:hypothetical protein